MADLKQKWTEANAEILQRLDIGAEFERMGLRLASSKPRATGWLPCHAIGREDRDPSAEINVGDGPARGRYRDFGGGGESVSFWDFASRYGPGGGDWREARKHYADKLGVKLPTGKEDLPRDRFDFFDLTPGVCLLYANRKPPVTPQAILECGGVGARWPRNLPPEILQHLICFPSYGAGLLDSDPIGYGCVESMAGKVRLYKGKGAEPELLKTMTAGSPGLMNVWALKHIRDAEVIWVLEGLTDMLTWQSLVPEEIKTRHVAVTTGAASYHPRAEWMQYFAGKDVRICLDNDVDATVNAGQVGASFWVTACVPVAAAVRNVLLPVNDVREFLTNHTYHDLWELSQACQPIDAAGAKAAEIAPHEAILKQLGVLVSGQLEGTDHVEIFSTRLHKKTIVRDVDRFSHNKATLALGGEVMDQYVTESEEPVPGKYQMKALRNAIMKVAADRKLSTEAALGMGIWRLQDGLVLIGDRSADLWTIEGGLQQTHSPSVNGQRLDFSGNPWYEREELGRLITQAGSHEWCGDVLDEAVGLFSRWDNWVHSTNPELIAGLLAATWIQTLWHWRPLAGLVGSTNSGKSIFNECLASIFGAFAFACAKSTEAGIRLMVGNTACALLIDEFEDDQHRSKVLELLRTSSRGSKIVRGTSAQKSASYGLKHIVWLGAIDLGLRNQADRNRFLMLELGEVKDYEGRIKLELPAKAKMASLGQRTLAIAICHHAAAIEMAAALNRQAYGADRRIVESMSVPAAMTAVARGMSATEAHDLLERWLLERNFASQEEREQDRLLAAIFEAVVVFQGGHRTSVSQLLAAYGEPNKSEWLRSVGIRKLANGNLFFATAAVRKELLKGTDFANMDIGQLLVRLEGAVRDLQRMPHHSRGVTVPELTIEKIMGGVEKMDGSQQTELDF